MKPWERLAMLGIMITAFAACAGPEAELARQDSAQAHYDIGLGALAENNLSKAISELQIAVQEDPSNARYHHGLGNAYLRNQQLDEAIASLRRASELNPRLSDAFNDLGAAYMQREKWDLAIDAFRKALANPRYLNPERAYVNLGNVYYIRGQYGQAAEEFRRLLDLYPQSSDGHFFLGRTLLSQGRFPEAQEQIEQAIKLDGTVPLFHMELGIVLMRAGRRMEARDSFRRALELNLAGPDAEQARRYLRELN
jgi:Tfp pilus assembly protein PilF